MKTKKILQFILLIISLIILYGFTHTPTQTISRPNHTEWDQLLNKYVSINGYVNYMGFIKEQNKLNRFLHELKQHHPDSNWSKDEQKAYWINAYNAFTIKLIIDHYPINSIKEIYQGPWDSAFIYIQNTPYTLQKIRDSILRKKFNDPRIHFAISTAAISNPKLLNKAYTKTNIEYELNKATYKFINDVSKNIVTENFAELSQLFYWYRDDFTTNGNITQYINQYSVTRLSPKAEITYMKFNWSINEL